MSGNNVSRNKARLEYALNHNIMPTIDEMTQQGLSPELSKIVWSHANNRPDLVRLLLDNDPLGNIRQQGVEKQKAFIAKIFEHLGIEDALQMYAYLVELELPYDEINTVNDIVIHEFAGYVTDGLIKRNNGRDFLRWINLLTENGTNDLHRDGLFTYLINYTITPHKKISPAIHSIIQKYIEQHINPDATWDLYKQQIEADILHWMDECWGRGGEYKYVPKKKNAIEKYMKLVEKWVGSGIPPTYILNKIFTIGNACGIDVFRNYSNMNENDIEEFYPSMLTFLTIVTTLLDMGAEPQHTRFGITVNLKTLLIIYEQFPDLRPMIETVRSAIINKTPSVERQPKTEKQKAVIDELDTSPPLFPRDLILDDGTRIRRSIPTASSSHRRIHESGVHKPLYPGGTPYWDAVERSGVGMGGWTPEDIQNYKQWAGRQFGKKQFGEKRRPQKRRVKAYRKG